MSDEQLLYITEDFVAWTTISTIMNVNSVPIINHEGESYVKRGRGDKAHQHDAKTLHERTD